MNYMYAKFMLHYKNYIADTNNDLFIWVLVSTLYRSYHERWLYRQVKPVHAIGRGPVLKGSDHQ